MLLQNTMKCSTKGAALRKEPHTSLRIMTTFAQKNLSNHGLLKIRHIFAKIIRGQFFKCEGSDNIGYCNYSLLFHGIFCNLFSILIHLYRLHGIFVKTFCIKVFYQQIKRKMCSFHHDGKKF